MQNDVVRNADGIGIHRKIQMAYACELWLSNFDYCKNHKHKPTTKLQKKKRKKNTSSKAMNNNNE